MTILIDHDQKLMPQELSMLIYCSLQEIQIDGFNPLPLDNSFNQNLKKGYYEVARFRYKNFSNARVLYHPSVFEVLQLKKKFVQDIGVKDNVFGKFQSFYSELEEMCSDAGFHPDSLIHFIVEEIPFIDLKQVAEEDSEIIYNKVARDLYSNYPNIKSIGILLLEHENYCLYKLSK